MINIKLILENNKIDLDGCVVININNEENLFYTVNRSNIQYCYDDPVKNYAANVQSIMLSPGEKHDKFIVLVRQIVFNNNLCIFYKRGQKKYAEALKKLFENLLFGYRNLINRWDLEVEYNGKTKTINEHVIDFVNSTDIENGIIKAYGKEVYLNKKYAWDFSDMLLFKAIKSIPEDDFKIEDFAADCIDFVQDYKEIVKDSQSSFNLFITELKRLTADGSLPKRKVQYEVPHTLSVYEIIKNKRYSSKYIIFMSDNQNELIKKMIKKYTLNNIKVPSSFKQADYLIKKLMRRIDKKEVHRRRNWQQGHVEDINGIYVYISDMEDLPYAAN